MTPLFSEGFTQVSQSEFFSVVGPLDVHPYIVLARYDPRLGYRSQWKTRQGEIVGETVGGTLLLETQFALRNVWRKTKEDTDAPA